MKKALTLLVTIIITYLGFSYVINYKNMQKQLHSGEISEIKKTFLFGLNQKSERIAELEQQLFEKTENGKIYIIVAGGDLMFDRGVKGKLRKLDKDYNFLFEYITEYLNNADLVFANLEGSLSDVGHDLGSKYSFRFELAVADAMQNAGFDVVSLANNHILNWGRDSLCATVGNLENVGIKSVGAGCNSKQAEHAEIIKLGNTRIAFLAYTEFYLGAHATETKPGLSEYKISKIKKRVSDLRESGDTDLIFVSMHWGEEYKNRAPERIVAIGQELIDAGVDVIIGHHPHVDQEIERYGDGWIIYSLGNFIFDQSFSVETMQGLFAEIKIQNGKVVDIAPQFIKLNSNFQPELVN